MTSDEIRQFREGLNISGQRTKLGFKLVLQESLEVAYVVTIPLKKSKNWYDVLFQIGGMGG